MSTSNNPPPTPHLDALLAEAGWVLKLAKRLARDQATAEDIAQGTLALALEKRPPVDGGLRPWLARVAGRLARHRVRGDARRSAREHLVVGAQGAESAASDEALIRFELQQDLSRRVDALPDPYRRAVIYRYYEGLSIQEIATAAGVPASTVRTQLARGLERIRLQYDGESDHRSALGVFLLASNSSTNFITRRAAEIALMQTSTKLALVGVAALIAFVSLTTLDVLQWERVASGGEDQELVITERAPTAVGEVTLGGAPPPESNRGVVSAPSSEPEIAAVVLDALAPVTILRARILGVDGKPLVGGSLSSIHVDGSPRGLNSTARSDDEGRAVLKLKDADLRMVGDDVYDMTFAIAGAGHGTKIVVKSPALHGDTDLGEIQLGAGGSILGQVVDASGQGIAGAVLYASSGELAGSLEGLRISGPAIGATRPRAVSGADGTFEVSGISVSSAGSGTSAVRLWAHTRGALWTISGPIALTEPGKIDLGRLLIEQAPEELRLEGTVFRPSGSPAAGARVDFASTGAPHYGHVFTDASGAFVVIPTSDAPMELVARDTRAKDGVSHSKIAGRGESVELELLPRRSMTVTITDTTGAPIRAAHVMPVLAASSSASDDEGRLVPGVDWASSDEAGRVEIEVPGQRFRVVVRKFGSGEFSQGPFEPASAPEAIEVIIPPVYEVSGRVFAYGVPVAGAKVAAMRRLERFAAMTGGFPNRYASGVSTVVTDSEGRFVAPLKLGWPAIGVLVWKDGLAVGEVTPDIAPGGKIRGVEIHMTEGGAIEGYVIPPLNTKPGGLVVGASRGDGRPHSTLTDSEGRYRFEGLTPGNWRVEGRLSEVRTEMLSTSDRPDDMDPQWNAVVVDRQTLGLDVDMRHLGDVQVQGRLRIDGAAPPPGWRAELVFPKHDRGPGEVAAVSLDSDGRFVMTTRPGRADLHLRGTLPGGAVVDVVRELQLESAHLDWKDNLTTAWLEETVEGGFQRARFTRGDPEVGAREITTVPMDELGQLRARIPVGNSALEATKSEGSRSEDWELIRVFEVL